MYVCPVEYDLRGMKYIMTLTACTLPATGYNREYQAVGGAACTTSLCEHA